MAFAVDQQQYLQGYLPIVFLTLYASNLNTVGGGRSGAHRPWLRHAGQRRRGRATSRPPGHADLIRPGRGPIRPPPATAPDWGITMGATDMATVTAPAVSTTDERLGRTSLFKRLLIRPEFGALAGAIVVWVLFATQARSVWLSWQGTATYLDTSALYGLTALAVALLMIGGEFDLSSGVMTGTTGMFTGIFAVEVGMNIWLGMVLSLAIALAIGFLNGYMVIKSGLPSFIVTLGTFFILRGFNLWLTQRVTGLTNVTGVESTPGSEAARKIFAGTLFTIGNAKFSVAILWFLVMAAIGTWVLMRTRVGNWIFAVGGNRDAARMIGVPANATKIGLFMTVAFCGWVHGQVVLMQTNRANVIEGVGQEFYFIIAAVLGGLPADGRLRLDRRRRPRLPDPRHDPAGHPAGRLGQQPVLPVPRRHPARRRVRQRVDQAVGADGVETARSRQPRHRTTPATAAAATGGE